MTLVEMVVVLTILIALAGAVIALVPQTARDAAEDASETSMVGLREAIVGSADRPGYRGDLGALPAAIRDLLVAPAGAPTFDPSTSIGWRGPYVLHRGSTYAVDVSRGFTTDYGADGDPTMHDAWSNPIVLQYPKKASAPDFTAEEKATYVRLVSAGPDGVIDTPIDLLTPAELTPALRGDDIVVFLNVSDS